MTTDCASCHRVPVTDNATLCYGCTSALREALLDCVVYAAELEVTASRQTASGRAGGAAVDQPLPFDEKASDAAHALRNMLTGWVRLCGEADDMTGPLPADTSSACADWLAARVPALRRFEVAAELLADVQGAVRQAKRLVDHHPPERVFLGPCNAESEDRCCLAWLYARRDAARVVCWNCGAEHDVEVRRAWLLKLAEDRLAPASEISRALHGWGVDVKPSLIWKWAERGRLAVKGTDARNRPLYRVGDVRSLVVEAEVRYAQGRTA